MFITVLNTKFKMLSLSSYNRLIWTKQLGNLLISDTMTTEQHILTKDNTSWIYNAGQEDTTYLQMYMYM